MGLFPFLVNYTIDEQTSVLYNMVTQDALYYDMGRYTNICKLVEEIKSFAYSEKFIGESSFREYVKDYARFSSEKIDFRILKMFITTRCNLACKYCLIEKNIEYRHRNSKDLTCKNALSVINNFSTLCKKQKPSSKTIMLYGGEPIINWEVLRTTIEYIRTQELQNAFNGSVEVVLETNGTLVSVEIAQFLAHHNIEVIVSVDGIEEVHNHYRKDKNGNGSWEKAVRGYKLLKNEGCHTVVSSVFTEGYAQHLNECLAFLKEDLGTPSIGLNLLHVLQDSCVYNDTSLRYIDSYIKAFEISSNLGLYIEHIMRRIRPLIEKKIRTKDCGACGKRVVSDCNGAFGICEAFIGDDKYFTQRSDISSLYCDATFLEWNKRTVFRIPQCDGCIAWAICGGGCVNNAINQHGNIFAPDNHICETSKAFIGWALKRWYEDNDFSSVIARDGFHYLCDNERLSLLHSLKLDYRIPLQTMSKQNEQKNE